MPPSLVPPAIETGEVPTYQELVERYNANAARVERLWARTNVEMRWRTDRGKARRESGDGRLVFRRPLDTAMTVEVLGDTKLWAGSDASGFWVFDLHEAGPGVLRELRQAAGAAVAAAGAARGGAVSAGPDAD